MSPAFYLLTATWLATQPPSVPTVPVAPRPAPAVISQTIPVEDASSSHSGLLGTPPAANAASSERRGLFSRIQDRIGGLFRGQRRNDTASPPASENPTSVPGKPPVKYTEPPLANPMQPGQPAAGAANLTPPSAPRNPNVPTQVREKFTNKIGHEDDYSWITGQLYHVKAGGGQWLIRYATVETVDTHSGCVVLAPGADLKDVREGDLVSVQGQLVNDPRNRPLGCPVYRATAVNLIER